MTVNGPVLTARLVFDASVGEWLCEMTDTEDPGEGRFVGSGPDPLAAALSCAEIASAAWWALAHPDEKARIVTSRGHEYVNSHGEHRPVRAALDGAS